MTKAVIFDFGNVLGMFDKKKACEQLAESSPYSADEIFSIIVGRKLERMLESGQMSETAFCNEVIHHCKLIKLTVPDVMRIWGNIFTPNPAIDFVVDRLIEQKVPIGILSNTNGIHWPYIMDLPVMRKLQDYGAPQTLSHELRAFKPDAKMFETALTRLGTKPEETLYLDDIQEYVDAARSIGMESAHYDCTKNSSRISAIMTEHGLM
ncbi:MAG: HAD family phosphatase [Minisyncoccia bacterium]